MAEMLLRTLEDLEAVRNKTDLDRVEVHAESFKFINLLPLALKYALFAVKPGGAIVVVDKGRDDPVSGAFEVAFSLVRQWTFKLLGDDTELVEFDPANGRIVLRRTRPVTPPGWSAGVIFSGSEGEVPALVECLKGLVSQAELAPEAGGEIVVCGPRRDLAFLAAFPTVRYLEYDPEPGPRFLVGIKKNFLAANLKAPRIAIMHARIVLQPGALAAVPREFDIGSPNVLASENGRMAPYLSLGFSDANLIGRMARRLSVTMRVAGRRGALAIHRLGWPYVDGGVFFAASAVYAACPLDARIAWGEAEDVEWCARAAANGYLVDLFADASAISQTNKLNARPALPPLVEGVAMRAIRLLRWSKSYLKFALRFNSGR